MVLSLLVLACSPAKTNSNAITENTLDNQPITTCHETPKVNDSAIELDYHDNLNGLTFTTAYHRIHTHFDTISEHALRSKTQEFINSIILKSFDDIIEVRSENLVNMDYRDQMQLTGDLKWYSRKKSSVNGLTVKGLGNKQLYLELVTYYKRDRREPQWKNKISLFVFNTELDSLAYLNEYEYFCDPRDTIALRKVINYGLEMLKTSSTE